ncbi:MAG: hypothetical protein KGL46_10590 [Hyphomicrobiales bacterium]|nr:hypothetical protein [Hyphomicrobiales bacterium]
MRNLGSRRPQAGLWKGERGVAPKAPGPRTQAHVDHIALQSIDPQSNGRCVQTKIGDPTPDPLMRTCRNPRSGAGYLRWIDFR